MSFPGANGWKYISALATSCGFAVAAFMLCAVSQADESKIKVTPFASVLAKRMELDSSEFGAVTSVLWKDRLREAHGVVQNCDKMIVYLDRADKELNIREAAAASGNKAKIDATPEITQSKLRDNRTLAASAPQIIPKFDRAVAEWEIRLIVLEALCGEARGFRKEAAPPPVKKDDNHRLPVLASKFDELKERDQDLQKDMKQCVDRMQKVGDGVAGEKEPDERLVDQLVSIIKPRTGARIGDLGKAADAYRSGIKKAISEETLKLEIAALTAQRTISNASRLSEAIESGGYSAADGGLEIAQEQLKGLVAQFPEQLEVYDRDIRRAQGLEVEVFACGELFALLPAIRRSLTAEPPTRPDTPKPKHLVDASDGTPLSSVARQLSVRRARFQAIAVAIEGLSKPSTRK
jgi:hypothetical protein